MGTVFNFFSTRIQSSVHHVTAVQAGKKSCGGIFSTRGRRVVRLRNASVAWSVRVRPAISALFSARLPRLDSKPRELLTESSSTSSSGGNGNIASHRSKKYIYIYIQMYIFLPGDRFANFQTSSLVLRSSREEDSYLPISFALRSYVPVFRSLLVTFSSATSPGTDAIESRARFRSDGWLARLSIRESSRKRKRESIASRAPRVRSKLFGKPGRV